MQENKTRTTQEHEKNFTESDGEVDREVSRKLGMTERERNEKWPVDDDINNETGRRHSRR